MHTVVVGLVAIVAFSGCGTANVAAYRDGVSANQQALASLELGMTRHEAVQIMGQGEIVRYKKIYLVDPWRSESFTLADGTEVLLLLYLTQFPKKYASPDDRALTPLVFEDGSLVGWGWSYLDRNLDRYQVGTPRPQR